MNGRLLGIDYGTKRIGVAISDELGWTAQGQPSLSYDGDESLCDTIVQWVSSQAIVMVVVGHPIHMNGTRGERAQQVERFVTLLRTRVEIPVVLWDERLTTVVAQKTLVDASVRRSKRKQVVDQLAATLLLQSYLDYSQNQAKR